MSDLSLLERAIQARDASDVSRLSDQLAASASSCEPFGLVTAAVSAKEAGFKRESERLLDAASKAHGASDSAHFELGALRQSVGNLRDAVPAYADATRVNPAHARYALAFATALYGVGAHPEADAELERARHLPGVDAQWLEVVQAYGRYLRLVPAGRAAYLIRLVKARYGWLLPHDVATAIHGAMDRGDGFSLVRLGDGEGPWARISPEDEARFAPLYGWLRRTWATLLFGEGFDPDATGYSALAQTLMDACADADVAGLPYPSWVEHEYATASVRGVPGLVNVHRWFLEHAERLPRSPRLCRQDIHVALHREGHLEPILRRAKRIALISSNAPLAEAVRQRFGLDEVELFRIPAERYSAGVRDAASLAGVHFPHAFHDITRRLSTPQHGRVVLIAAGTLAKFYAQTVKRHGGIALDIGSLADAWMNIASRPGYEASMAL